MKEKILNHEEFGELRFHLSKKARRISIALRPFRGIKVTVPASSTFENALDFVKHKEAWIRESLKKIESVEKKQTIFEKDKHYQTRYHHLVLRQHDTPTIKIKIINKKIIISYPTEATIAHPRVQEAIRKGLTEAWRIEAKYYIPRRVKMLAEKHGFTYQMVRIKNASSRWGSCSARNNLNFSLYLMHLPNHLIDYVILHELAHTVHKNHGIEFWRLLHKISGNAKGLDKELRDYRTNIF